MKVYTFDPHLYLREIVLVGCGGTGSQLARAVARMIYSMKAARQSVPRVCFIDPDVVELPNVGRQLFTHAEVGLHKAEALAWRFNYSLGLSIEC
ncbi:MAG: ThiF family adenylyltransferase, partial [Anaerolineae bacterium]|nr:ThiF family adenylyltransferase [Anaerolineae bacterium]